MTLSLKATEAESVHEPRLLTAPGEQARTEDLGPAASHS